MAISCLQLYPRVRIQHFPLLDNERILFSRTLNSNYHAAYEQGRGEEHPLHGKSYLSLTLTLFFQIVRVKYVSTMVHWI